MSPTLHFIGSPGNRELWISPIGGNEEIGGGGTVNGEQHFKAAWNLRSPLTESEELTTDNAKLFIAQAAEKAGVTVDVVLEALSNPNIGKFSY